MIIIRAAAVKIINILLKKKKLTKHQIFVLSSLGFIFGIGFGDFLSFRPVVVLVGVLMCFFFLIKRTGVLQYARTSFILFVLFIFFGLAYIGFYRQHQKPSYLPFNQQMAFQGTIAREVDRELDAQKIILRTTKFGKSLDHARNKPTNIYIKTGRYPEYKFGDLLQISGKLKKPEAFDGFDWPGYLEKDGVYSILINPPKIKRIDQNHGNLFITRLYRLRQKFEDSLNRSFPEPNAALTAGIILGVKRNIPNNLMDNLNKTGLTHVVAVSGYNVTIIVTILVGLGISRTIKRRFQILTGFILFFVILTGGSASVVRGGIVAWLSIWARANSRIAWPLPLLLATVLLMILHNPLILIHDIGFQLSTAAFFGLLCISPMAYSAVRAGHAQPLRLIPKSILSSAIETISASIPTIPLTMFYFHRFSTVFVLTNLLVLWTIPLIMALGFIAGVGGMIHPSLGIILAQPCIVVENYLLWIVEVFGGWGLAAIDI